MSDMTMEPVAFVNSDELARLVRDAKKFGKTQYCIDAFAKPVGSNTTPLYLSQPQPVAQGEAVGEFYVKCVRCHGEGMADIYVGSTGGSFMDPPDPVFERDACPECDGACFVLATPTTPTGHRVVPVEPTVAMNSKGAESLHESEVGGVSFDSSAAFAYKAMLSAAPDAGGV